MMRLYTILIFSLLMSGTSGISAQDKKWTLEECIDYAVSNNIGLQRQKLETETADVNLLQSKMAILPSVNMGANASINFGRSVDPQTNLITFNRNLSNEYTITSEINLFKGFTTLNTISANRFMYKAGLEAEKIARNELIINVLGQYYQVIYARGLENSAKMQMDLSETQLFRITKMVETGREALSKQFEMESTASSDRLKYTTAHNTAIQAVTTLRQMLQIEPGTEFDILIPDLNNMLITDSQFGTDSIYQIASAVLPRLKAIEYELNGAKKQVAVARGNISPAVSLGGGIYTGYYTAVNDSINYPSFSRELKNNNSQYTYLSVNIPLFNNFLNWRAIRLAKIRKSDAELRLQLEKNSLYTEIENACLSYNSGKDEYLAAKANLEFNKKSFSAVEKKFEAGLVGVNEYSIAKTTLFVAETEELRTKLQTVIRKFVIQFYSTGEYESIIF